MTEQCGSREAWSVEREAWVRRYLPPFGFTGHSSLATRHSPFRGSAVDAAFHRYWTGAR